MLLFYLFKWRCITKLYVNFFWHKKKHALQWNIQYKNKQKLLSNNKGHFSQQTILTNNSQLTNHNYLYWISNVKKHNEILKVMLYYTDALTITSTKSLKFENLFLNKFCKPYYSILKNYFDVVFITSPYVDILKVRTKVKAKKLFTLQVAMRFQVLEHITLPFWVNTYNTWVEYFYVVMYYKNYVFIKKYKYKLLLNLFYKIILCKKIL